MKSRGLLFALFLSLSVLGWAGTKGPLTDDIIHDRVQIKLAGDTIVKGGGLNIEVKDGVVTVSGKVESEKQKARAEKLAKKVDGVKSVNNQIQVAQH
ncbi:MAG: transport-associated protein [Bryobacterales bacterium]|nr:transport-associated protein [Bryobacterales bacterium]